MQLKSIKTETLPDDDPDLSYLGEYSETAGPNAIDRQERGDRSRGTYRYFNPAMSPKDTGNPDSVEQDYQRMESYNRGDWQAIGIRVTAEVVIGGVLQTITSAGLRGVESDSSDKYLDEIAAEQLDELRGILAEMGVSRKEINHRAGECRVDGLPVG